MQPHRPKGGHIVGADETPRMVHSISSVRPSNSTFSQPFKEKCISDEWELVVQSASSWVSHEKQSSSYCVVIFSGEAAGGNLKLIILGSERVKNKLGRQTSKKRSCTSEILTMLLISFSYEKANLIKNASRCISPQFCFRLTGAKSHLATKSFDFITTEHSHEL